MRFKYLKHLLALFLLTASLTAGQTTQAGLALEQQYLTHCQAPSDINTHIPHLKRLAQECSSAVEIGIRSMVSSWGVLQGLAESPSADRSYIGIDLNDPPTEKLNLARQLAEANGIHYQFWRGNDMDIEIEPTDLLFIDSLHTYCHLTYELEKFASKVNKYIALHDTSAPWGECDDNQYHGDRSEYPPSTDRTKRGLWPAVLDFLTRHPEWSLNERHFNNHGFTVLKRRSALQQGSDARIDHILQNKIILCTGPSLHRREMLKKTTEQDIQLIPFKKIFVATNDPDLMDITFLNQKPICEYIQAETHQLGSLNCIITSLKNAVSDPDSKDDDIIIFKHETVFINDMYLVRQAIGKLLDGYDMVVRYWAPDHFYMTNVFYIKVSAARAIFQNHPQATGFNDDYRFCEEYFTKYIANAVPNVYRIDYAHLTRKDNELGFYHVPPPQYENDAGYWNKANYYQLYK